MIATVVLTFVCLVGGLLAASIWATILWALAEVCVSLYDWGGRHAQPILSMTAFLAALVLLSYGALTFVALVISLTRHFLSTSSDLFNWPFWIAAYVVAEWPGFLLVKLASRTEKNCPIQLIPLGLLPVALLAFFALIYRQTFLEAGWWWIPYMAS